VTTLTTLGSPYTQDFNTLAIAGTSSTLPAGWVFLETGANANTLYTAGTGSGNAGDTYSFGAAASSERALGGLQSGNLLPTIGAQFTNSTGATLTSLAISYTGEQWRLGTLARTDRIDFQYSLNATSLNTGTWTDVNALDFNAPTTTGVVGLLNGNAAANRTALSDVIPSLSIANGATFWIRWSSFDATGADDGLAVDDFSLNANGFAGPTSVNLSVSANAASATEADATVVTVTATASAPVVGNQTVTLAVSGTGITASDYTLSNTTITILDGQTTGSVTFEVVDDNATEPTETAQLTISDPSAGIVLGGTVSQSVSIADNDPLFVRIHDIQGATHRSPFNGMVVSAVPGIVTAVASNGFYFQDPSPDADPSTSEGIFVFTSSPPTVSVGDAVQVTGTVFEFRPGGDVNSLSITELTSPSVIVLSSGNALPDATVLGQGGRVIPNQVIYNDAPSNVEAAGGDFEPAVEGIDFWESLEGMRVQINNPVTSSPTAQFGTSDELWVLADQGANASVTARGGALISANDFNPERIQLDDLNPGINFPDVDVGTGLATVIGIVNYAFSNYEVLVSTAPVVTQASSLQKEVSSLVGSGDRLTVATFNVENLDPSDGAAKFGALATAIVGNLRAPDIINLEEVQDNNGATNNGVVDASLTLQTLVDAIAAAGGPTYHWRQIDPANNTSGGEPGGNIRVVFLFNPARVSYVDGSLTNLVDTQLGDGDAFANSRKPLVADFTFNGETVTLIGNHFNSKGGDQALFGATQPPLLNSEAQRMQQAGVVKGYVEQLLLADAQAKVLVLGDLNDFEFSEPLTTLESAGLTSLVETLPANERYSYNFEGNAQTLDHIQASASLLGALRGYDVVHINSEFAQQVSDHDPALAMFLIERDGIVVMGTRGRDNLVGTSGTDTIVGGQGRDVLTGGGAADAFVYTGLIDAGDVITDFTPGSDQLVIAALMASVGAPANANPVGGGYLGLAPGVGRSNVLFDPDGSAGTAVPRILAELVGVTLADAAVLLDPALYMPA
jgi:uncharacterized protein